MSATFRIDDYVIVIPMVQNFYAPTKEEHAEAWTWELRYSSGVFESFTYKTYEEACEVFEKFMEALNEHWKDES